MVWLKFQFLTRIDNWRSIFGRVGTKVSAWRGTMIAYDEAEARKTDRAYQTPDVTRQRMRTLEALQLKAGEIVIDVG